MANELYEDFNQEANSNENNNQDECFSTQNIDQKNVPMKETIEYGKCSKCGMPKSDIYQLCDNLSHKFSNLLKTSSNSNDNDSKKSLEKISYSSDDKESQRYTIEFEKAENGTCVPKNQAVEWIVL